MTLDGHFALNSISRRYIWRGLEPTWLSKIGYTLKLVMNDVREL